MLLNNMKNLMNLKIWTYIVILNTYNKVYLKIPKIRIKLISKFNIKWKRNGEVILN